MKNFSKIVLLLLFYNFSFSQNEIKITYNESIHISRVTAKTDFYIIGENGKTHLKGYKINEYLFQIPGKYIVKINWHLKSKKDDCEHLSLPKEITILVSRIKMTFDGSNVAFSEPIRKNLETSKISVSIPVKIETYDKKPIRLNPDPINTSGIGSTIIAALNESAKELQEGTHILTYSLHGLVTQNSYLMFDFIDANNKIQSVALTTPIKD